MIVAGLGLATASLTMGPVAPRSDAAPPALADVPQDAAQEAPGQVAQDPPPALAVEETEREPSAVPAAPDIPNAPELEEALAPETVATDDVAADDAQPATAPMPEPVGQTAPVAQTADKAPQTEGEAPAAMEPVASVDAISEVPDDEIVPDESAVAGMVQALEETAPAVADAPAAAPEGDVAAAAVVAPEPETVPVEPELAEPESPEPGALVGLESDDSPPAAPQPSRSALPQIVVEAAPGAELKPAPEPEIVMVSPEADLSPELEADSGAAIVTDRLPRIGSADVEEPVAAPSRPALLRNAIAFKDVGDQPRLAFLLIDTGPDDRAALGDLRNLPFPVTVAIDASATDAEQALRFYRDQGAEVMLTVPLPEGATPTDVDITVEAYAPLLGTAVAVLAEESLGFQTLGPGAVQLATNLAETGHGLVTFPSGLNTGHKAALKEGVKAGLVFRDLDGEGQDGPVIRRFLDNAAFKARGEAGVIVVARTRAETLQALLEWSLGTRAQSVALAPVSAVLARH